MSSSAHHVYVPIDILSNVKPPLTVRNIKTIGFVRDDFIFGLCFDSNNKASVGSHKIKANLDYIGPRMFLHYSPYLIYAVVDWVDGEPLITPKHMKEMTADVWKYHSACLEIVKLFPTETMEME